MQSILQMQSIGSVMITRQLSLGCNLCITPLQASLLVLLIWWRMTTLVLNDLNQKCVYG